MKKHWGVLILAGAILLAACGDEGDPFEPAPGNDMPTQPVSFSEVIQPIFDARCTQCHGAVANGGLDLRSPRSRDNLVGVLSPTYGAPRVRAGDPGGSVLFDKVSGGGLYGDRMPLAMEPLSETQIASIRSWIAQGALPD